MKKILCFIFIIFLAGSLFAQGFILPGSMFAGLSPEINGYTRSGLSFGGSLQFGMDLNSFFSLGQKTSYFTDFDSIHVVELLVFFRYYLPWLHLPSPDDGPFVQAEIGTALVIESGFHVYDEIFPHFLGGVSAGWRFNLFSNFYIEPLFRFGYPHTWGISVTAGLRFKQRKEEVIYYQTIESEAEFTLISTNSDIYIQEPEPVALIAEQSVTQETTIIEQAEVPWRVFTFINENGTEEHILTVHNTYGGHRVQLPPIVFRANFADFTGLNAALLDSNGTTLRRIAQLMNTNNDYHLIIEGHANPTTPEGARRQAETPSLIQLSADRAQRIRDELVNMGVDCSRLIIAGMGSSAEIVPYNDRNNGWKNRRVEFILLTEGNNE